MGYFKFVAHKESIVLCLHPLFNVTPGEPLQLLAPAEGPVTYVTEFCRDDNFLQHNAIKEDFFFQFA